MNNKPYYVPILDNGQGSCRTTFLWSFLHSFADRGICAAKFSDSHPGRARNRAAAAFLLSDCDYMLFIDSDIVFTAEHIKMLEESDEPILAGMYCLKTREVKPCLATLPGFESCATGGLIEVLRTGTGFLRIHRSVLEGMKAVCERYTNSSREEWDFFRSFVSNNEWLSEDWGFCELARAAGFRVMVDTRIQVKHEGTVLFPWVDSEKHLAVCPDNMLAHVHGIWQGEYDVPYADPRTILDIGANVGGFTLWASDRFPDASIIAYEPSANNAALWRWNNGHLKQASIVEAGVRASAGTGTLVQVGHNCGELELREQGDASGPSARIIAAVDLPRAEFVKLDTEGCELEILQHYDLAETKWVALEYHSELDREEIARLMHGKGFVTSSHKPSTAVTGILKFTRGARI